MFLVRLLAVVVIAEANAAPPKHTPGLSPQERWPELFKIGAAPSPKLFNNVELSKRQKTAVEYVWKEVKDVKEQLKFGERRGKAGTAQNESPGVDIGVGDAAKSEAGDELRDVRRAEADGAGLPPPADHPVNMPCADIECGSALNDATCTERCSCAWTADACVAAVPPLEKSELSDELEVVVKSNLHVESESEAVTAAPPPHPPSIPPAMAKERMVVETATPIASVEQLSPPPPPSVSDY